VSMIFFFFNNFSNIITFITIRIGVHCVCVYVCIICVRLSLYVNYYLLLQSFSPVPSVHTAVGRTVWRIASHHWQRCLTPKDKIPGCMSLSSQTATLQKRQSKTVNKDLLLRGRHTRMCCFRLTSAKHSKFYAQQFQFSSVSLKLRVNWPLIKIKGNIII